eukprot:CAMPEP_0172322800 /NCGR_PEP_ID=MMETSP1058-20130122/46960_1 /TAXON_ID=83371 /ORGANISM="Detonula confervacea, Strain CCMP 353" /LENGTH=113 /DNA_ID=CAMNT_0013038641 /DNA_START=79 /DNA_END=417 /DNA_ORIENTATION=-
MNYDEAKRAKRLFQAEVEKLVEAKLSRTDAMNIGIHTRVYAAPQNATCQPTLEEGEEGNEEKYDGDMSNVLVGLKFPERFVRSAHDHDATPFGESVLRKLNELFDEGESRGRK